MRFELTKSITDGFPVFREYRGEGYVLSVADFGDPDLKFVEAAPINIHWPKISFKKIASLCSFEPHPFLPEDIPEMTTGMQKASEVYQYILENLDTL